MIVIIRVIQKQHIGKAKRGKRESENVLTNTVKVCFSIRAEQKRLKKTVITGLSRKN